MADKKTWAIILGTAAGVAAATIAISIYVQSHGGSEMKSVQDKIQWAHERLNQLEHIADAINKPEPA